MKLSLMNIMRDTPDYQKRIAKKIQEVKGDIENISIAAAVYGNKYEQEIAEGSELKNKLLTEGSAKGLKEEEIMGNYGKFVPCRQTPILNMLYFLLRESDDDVVYGTSLYERRDKINEFLVKNNSLDHDIADTTGNLTEDEASNVLNEFIAEAFSTQSTNIRTSINSIFNDEKSTRSDEDVVKLKDPENMVEYLYGSLTLEQFDILKKLKRLSKHNDNEHEAFLAYKKCNELCKQYNLDFDRIPS